MTSHSSRTAAAATHDNRVSIIGCGRVGMASAYALIQSAFVRELILVGRSFEKTEGEVMDLTHAVSVPMKSPVRVVNGTYADAARSSIVVVTAGDSTGGPDVSRQDLLEKNAAIVRDIATRLKREEFNGVLVMATNPVDVLSRLAQQVSGLPAHQVIGTGTLIDTARLRGLIAQELKVEPNAVDAYIVGEHGDSEVAVWSRATVAGVALTRYPGAERLPSAEDMLGRIRRAAPEVVKRKGHTAYAIGLCVQRICEAVLRDERSALAVSTLLTGQYGLSDVYLGTPCIIGRNGVEQVIELDLDAAEAADLRKSARTLKELQDSLED